MFSNPYENFRTVLTMNLCNVLPADQLPDVLQAVDVSLNDFEITKKNMDLIAPATVPDVIRHYLGTRAVANLSMETLKQYRYKLVHFFDYVRKPYTDITPNDIRMYLYSYKSEHHVSDNYLDNIRRVLSCFFAWLVANEYGITRNPCDKVEKIRYQEKKREPMTSYELELFRWNTENIREKALIDFFFSTGLRVSEVADVRLSDIDWNNRSVFVHHGKGNKERIVYFNAEAEVSLRAYLSTRSDATDGLFVNAKAPHQAIRKRALENIIQKVSRRSGFRVFPHRIRHTFATSGLRSGMSLDMLQQLLGHVKPETTLIYAKQDQLNIQREHQRVYA